eukprot:TRINITY_DN2501_c0_g1_i2.p1 TRINITY_DN2501_c0_g1~~TRINITY_DN2501_c0_g1_i2.p1  ORF type:complete len:155 (-),score=17.20 TRINITY_DN2501_c0_g1_i2:477-941(-)
MCHLFICRGEAVVEREIGSEDRFNTWKNSQTDRILDSNVTIFSKVGHPTTTILRDLTFSVDILFILVALNREMERRTRNEALLLIRQGVCHLEQLLSCVFWGNATSKISQKGVYPDVLPWLREALNGIVSTEDLEDDASIEDIIKSTVKSIKVI